MVSPEKTQEVIEGLRKENAELIRQNNDYGKETEIIRQAYDRHLKELAEKDKLIEELAEKNRINCQRADQSYNREIEVTKELIALKTKWNNLIKEVEKLKENWQKLDKGHINERFEAGYLCGLNEILSLLKPEHKE